MKHPTTQSCPSVHLFFLLELSCMILKDFTTCEIQHACNRQTHWKVGLPQRQAAFFTNFYTNPLFQGNCLYTVTEEIGGAPSQREYYSSEQCSPRRLYLPHCRATFPRSEPLHTFPRFGEMQIQRKLCAVGFMQISQGVNFSQFPRISQFFPTSMTPLCYIHWSQSPMRYQRCDCAANWLRGVSYMSFLLIRRYC